jgi:hypothetical protein
MALCAVDFDEIVNTFLNDEYELMHVAKTAPFMPRVMDIRILKVF